MQYVHSCLFKVEFSAQESHKYYFPTLYSTSASLSAAPHLQIAFVLLRHSNNVAPVPNDFHQKLHIHRKRQGPTSCGQFFSVCISNAWKEHIDVASSCLWTKHLFQLFLRPKVRHRSHPPFITISNRVTITKPNKVQRRAKSQILSAKVSRSIT